MELYIDETQRKPTPCGVSPAALESVKKTIYRRGFIPAQALTFVEVHLIQNALNKEKTGMKYKWWVNPSFARFINLYLI